MRRTRLFILLAGALAVAAAAGVFWSASQRSRQADASERPLGAGPSPPALRLERLAGTYPGALYVTAPPGDTRLFVVEQGGRIAVVEDGRPLSRPFLDLSGTISAGGERGLLGMAFDPRYASNGLFYVHFTDTAGDTRVVRYRVSREDPDVADAASAVVILAVDQPYANHNGGQLAFGPDGRLYVGLGDGGAAGDPGDRAQSSETLLGKIVRISSPQSSARVAVYAKGLRNPWRFSFDRRTGALWIGDVGQNAREEIDYLAPRRRPGANLGWSAYEGSTVYNAERAARLPRSAVVWPVTEYGRSDGASVIGGFVYRGSAIPRLRGWYLYGDWASARVWALRGPTGTPKPAPGLDRALPGITSFGQDAAGELYLTATDGGVHRIVR
jgi:glucose/arabinose dehydrogenase